MNLKALHSLGSKKPENEQDFFSKNDASVRKFNARMFNAFSVFALFIFLLLAVASCLPFFHGRLPLLSPRTRPLFMALSALYAAGVACTLFLQRTVERHPIPFLYTLYLSLYVAAIALSLLMPAPAPYSLLFGLRMMFPVLALDHRWRINICNNIVITAATLLSLMYKPVDVFAVDLLLSVVFTATGTVLAGLSLNNQMRYITVREARIDEQLELEKAKSSAKTFFLSNMSHEIRTPINSILGLDEMILRESNDPKISEYATNIKMSGDMLLKLISDILDFSKIEAGKLELITAEYELSSLIMDLVNMTTQVARAKHLEFTVNVDENMPHLLYGDELRVKQCILNILNNAVKYTEHGSITLDVGFRKLDSQRIAMSVRVEDTGIGIRAEDLPKLFSAFERIEEKRNRTIEGSGLGMPLVQMLLKKMGSELNVRSEYGKGSVFWFEIEQRVVWWEKIGNFNERYQQFLHKLSLYEESFHAPDAHILVVDDTRMNLLVVEGLLKQTRIRIDTALSGPEMLQKVRQRHYDVIFIDYRMPGMDGVEALHEMDALEGNLCRGVPCVALTANVTSGARDFFLNEGFVDYLSKPVDTMQLEQMLRRYLPPQLVVSVPRDMAGEPPEEGGRAEPEAPVAEPQFPGTDAEPEEGIALEALQGIDLEAALRNCGSADVLRAAVKEYCGTIETRAQSIESYAALGDYKNYTVQVHALKSSSRLIGAMDLGQMAADLEKCGDEEDGARIAAETPALLELYRSYAHKLSPCAQEPQDGGQRTPIAPERFSEALAAIKEYATTFDYNAIDSIIEMIDQYAVPPESGEWYAELKRCIRAGDSETVLRLLQKMEV